MKSKFTLIVAAMFLLMTNALWGQSRTQIVWTASEQGYENGQVIENVVFDNNVSAVFNKGSNSNAPKYYNTGAAIRCYGGNFFTVSSTQGNLTEITMSFASGEGTNAITTDVGTYENGTWTGSATEVTFTIGGTTGHRRIAVFDITYSGSGTPSCAIPTFSPAGGVYGEAQTVTINCSTAGATIYYTTDGTAPTTSSSVYSAPLTISETTTLKAMAAKAGMNNSNVATATYTIQQMTTITTIAGLWEFAANVGNTATPTTVVFNNWYVTGVKGGQACISDGQLGFVIYQSSHGFVAGDKLNGTVTCNALLYQNHYAELTGVHATDLTVVSGQEVPVLTTTIDNLTVQNYGTVIDLGTLTYNGSTFEDADGHTITPYNNFNLSPSPLTSLTANTQYHVKGVSIVYWSNNNPIQQIAPRSAEDFEEITSPTPNVATPTFTPAAGTYNAAQTVSIACATAGATIHYTTDGNNPTTSSTVYTAPITISETTTVKAMAVKEGMNNSAVATATYTIQSTPTPTVITIAEARALENNAYALVQGVVTFIDGRNIYIQDATAGIDLYLNNNTVPAELAVGDMVKAYGKKDVYKGLVELTGIDGSNSEEFTILSTGNTLPLAVKTIAEILADHANGDLLQSTRVKIVDATIGAINTSNNTPITQDGSTMNIYKIPAVEGLLEGDLVTVTGILGCYNAVQLRVASAADVLFTHPQLPVAATPTILPNGGTFTTTQTVTIACATEGATIHYTIDGTDPTETSPVYNAPFTLSQTTTVKAIAMKTGMIESEIAVAIFNFPTLMTIAEARALANDQYAFVEGVVTFMDGRNIYVQDATAGIVLYLNNNTVPSTLAIGDKVRGYGKKAVYKGLVELSNIDGGDEDAFQVVSTGNVLPIATKTIEECLAGAEGLLQSTRVTIEDAVIGEINTNGNTVLTQGDNSINIYKIPALTGIEANSHVNVTAVIGYFNAAQLRVAYPTDVVLLNANLSVAPSNLQGFTYEQGQGPSAAQTFTITGQYLANTVSVTAGEYYEMSTSANGTYASTLSIPTENGSLTGATVYVRLMAGLTMNNYLSTVTVSSGDDVVSLSLNGSVTISNAVATPTFTPTAGSYMAAQQVVLSCATEGATIHYTLDGTDPTEASPVYAQPIEVASDMTIKAIGMKLNWLNSGIATATYQIHTPITIAEARQLDNNQYATVEGIVTHIDGRNIYVQDATAAIVLYLNNNTVPSGLALGDKVRSYGKKSIYSGLVELTGINGNNANEFMVVSSGNTLPLVNKTIAQILEDYNGNNMLQSTRVRIVNAIIGTINNNGNTPIAQNGSEMNIYKLPVVEGLLAGDFVTVIGVVGCYNAAQLLVNNANDVQFTHRPTITATPASLSGFSYAVGNGPSATQSFVVSGERLENRIMVMTSSNIEISNTPSPNFQPMNGMLLFPENGVVSPTTIYVRLKAGLAQGTYNNEMITLSSNNADDVHIAVSGIVTEQGVTPTNGWVKISNVGEIAEGNRIIIAARHDNENVNSYFAMTAATSGKPEGVPFTSTMNGGDEVLPNDIVANAETFAWTVSLVGDKYMLTNESGQVLGYTSSTNFSTGGDNSAWSITLGTSIDTGVMVSNYTAFNIINGNVTNRAVALNSNHNYGPYSTSNMTNGNGANYNFYLDIFMNGNAATPTVSAPTFSPEGGTYFEAQLVTISCATPDATLYYSTVSENGPWTVYTEPINVSDDMTIWAYGEKEGFENSVVVSAEYIINDEMTIIFNQDWEGDWNGWTTACVLGTTQWTINSYGGNHYAYANAYNQGANEDWLISPAFDLDAYSNVNLSFRSARNYNGPAIEVYFSNDYDGQDPAAATWTLIECPLSQGSWNWVSSGDLSLDAFSGSNCNIAYRYQSTDDQAAGWEVDDIMLYSGAPSNDPYLTVSPNALNGFSHIVGEGPSEAQTFVLTGGNFQPMFGGYGSITLSLGDLVPTYFEMSLDGQTYSTSLTIALDESLQLDPTTVYVRLHGNEIGQYNATILIEGPSGVSAQVALSGQVLNDTEPILVEIMPLYIQGNNGSNNNRVPVAVPVAIIGLNPNTTYRYVNQFVDINDGPETAGAGNVIYANPNGFYRTTSPSLATEGAYGEFTTDSDGTANFWCINEPTANARFTPGNNVYLRVRINDGNDGTSVAHILTTYNYATVLNFGTEAGSYQGSSFYVSSNVQAMTFALMYASNLQERPVYGTPVETTGVDYTSISQYATFYKDEVAGKNGYFGGILPNDNPTGINLIMVLDMDGYLEAEYSSLNGTWGTVSTINPSNGLDNPIFIDLINLNVAEFEGLNVNVWNVDHEMIVENDEEGSVELTVFNVLGQPVLNKTVAGGSHERFAHKLADGIYLVSLRNSKGSAVTKIFVK